MKLISFLVVVLLLTLINTKRHRSHKSHKSGGAPAPASAPAPAAVTAIVAEGKFCLDKKGNPSIPDKLDCAEGLVCRHESDPKGNEDMPKKCLKPVVKKGTTRRHRHRQ